MFGENLGTVTIRNDHLSATIAARGAELVSLAGVGIGELLWSADPAVWPWHAPNLFPIVGGLADDTLVHDGRRYPMPRHGFLRHRSCEVISATPDSCVLLLCDSEATRAQYPFAFALTITYRLHRDRISASFELHNPGSEPLFASIGAHPAFRWPLGDAPRTAHRVWFEQAEPAPIRRLANGLIEPQPARTPVEGHELLLEDRLFDDDALIFDRLVSRRVTFGVPGGPAIELSFPDFPDFGIWTKPGGAPFLCLEPWQGHASPVGFAGEFKDKPGVVELAPEATRVWRYAIRPVAVMAAA